MKKRFLGGLMLSPFALAGCGYYPLNHAAIAVPRDKSLTYAVSVLPTTITKRANKYDDVIRMESLASLTWNLKSDGLFITPSFYYLGFGSGAGYVFGTHTVLAAFGGASISPVSIASGLSVSQAVLSRVFLEYRLNYSKLHYKNCAFGCFEMEAGELGTFHTIDIATLFGKFYSEFRFEAAGFRKEYLSFGIALGMQVAR